MIVIFIYINIYVDSINAFVIISHQADRTQVDRYKESMELISWTQKPIPKDVNNVMIGHAHLIN